MNIREWAKRILCFGLGVVVAGVLMVASTSHAIEPRQSLEQRVEKLEQKVAAIEGRENEAAKAAEEGRKAARDGAKEWRQQQRDKN